MNLGFFSKFRSLWPSSTFSEKDSANELPPSAPVPLIWMLGKTGSGKTSIIRFITGADDAEIGGGFRPQTQHSQEFGFPDHQSPLVRFLEHARFGRSGLRCQPRTWKKLGRDANLVIITVRVTDQATDELLTPLQKIREQQPDRPTLLVITATHDACPGQTEFDDDMLQDLNDDKLPDALRRCLRAQLDRFDGLYDSAIAIDLTKPEDGFHPNDLGGDGLFDAIMDAMPAAMRATLGTMHKLKSDLQASPSSDSDTTDSDTTNSDTLILAHATLAAGAAAVPIAWIDMPVVLGIQTHLAHQIAKRHGESLTPAALARLSVVLGGRAAIRMAVKGFAKLIPVVGSAINSAAAFALLFASGKVLDWYFAQVADGRTPSQEEIAEMYGEQIEAARKIWRQRRLGDNDSQTDTGETH